jgi:DHA2 family multidrug resistance protein
LRRIDFLGALCVVVFLGSLQFVLEEGVREQWFESREILFFTALATLGGLGMLVRELSIEEPIVELRAFRDFNFAIGSIYSFIMGVGIYTVLFLMPVHLATVKGLNSLQIGQYLMVTGGFQFLSAFLAGTAARWMDSRLMLAVGLAIYGTGCWMNGFMNADWGYAEMFMPQALRGISMMFIFLPINALALGTLPSDEVQNASGLFNLTRNLGGAIGLAVANTLMVGWRKEYYAHLRGFLSADEPRAYALWQQLSGAALQHGSPDAPRAGLELMARMAWREAEVMTTNQMFQLLGAMFFAALLLMPLVRKVDMAQGGAGH